MAMNMSKPACALLLLTSLACWGAPAPLPKEVQTFVD